ncbi:MAG: prepilin-type N-terminal cleavage/methylation domain-containing protein [Rhodocyclaceae bacterium]|jgi:general secretion pathway protein G|nr:prepilin-type N-terminal cleavage/methylation domain-containing protein [Rhodocyclaceae bacterium]
MRTGHRNRGFSLLELAVVCGIAALLAAALISSLLRYQGIAEKEVVDVTVRQIRNGLRMEVAQLLLQGRQKQVPALVEQNPMLWLGRRPQAYLGEPAAPPAADRRGCWYFDPTRKELVYRPQSSAYPGVAEGAELRWKVVPSGSVDAGVKLVESGSAGGM